MINVNALQRVWQVLREEGLRSFWFKLIGDIGYRRIFLLERSLADPIPTVTSSLPLTMEWLRPDEFADYLAMRPATNATDFSDRFAKGHRCLGARYQGRLVGVMWACDRDPYILYLDQAVPLNAGDVYLFDAFTDPKFRGHAIAPALSAELLRQFRDTGCRRAIRGTAPENAAALRAHAKAGFRRYGVMGYIKLGPWRTNFCRDYPAGT